MGGQQLPTAEEIDAKIIAFLKETILLASYNYTQNLEDNINKSSLTLTRDRMALNDLREQANKARTKYEAFTSKNDLLKYGMGKEALKKVLAWINNELKLKLSKRDIISSITLNDIPEELKELLYSFSSIHPQSPVQLTINLPPQ